MKVLVIGGGGREHAMVWKLAQSPRVKEIICAPGNGGIGQQARLAPVKANDLDGLCELARKESVDLTVVGPEEPLCLGLVDRFTALGLRVFGPGQAGAELEGSKVWAKEFMARHGIPTAPFAVFDDPDKAGLYLKVRPGPVVVKADGLAAGKGVFVCDGLEEALAAVDQIMVQQAFGPAGARLIIEDRLRGEEASFIVLTDGQHVLPLPSTQDHKAALDGDRGPNTGGMGAYSPAPVVDAVMHRRIMDQVIRPAVAGLASEGRPYRGFLYAGLMITPEGPQVLEFNCRLGDPEAQPILIRLKSDFLDLIEAAAEGRLDQVEPRWDERASACVVMASGGYPGAYEKDKRIKGLDKAAGLEDVVVFHAGTRAEGNKVYTAGGRVLGVTALGRDIGRAVARAYEAVEQISWDGVHFRRDIGARAVKRPRVGLVLGSDSDWPTMQACADKLKDLGLACEVRVISAHRTPEEAAAFARSARVRGLKVLIAAAGGAAHLAGSLAAQTILPVIGVPLTATSTAGLDALLATVQMPPGVPVATVALDKWGAINAAVLAAQICALSDEDLAARLAEEKDKMKAKVKAGEERITS